MVEGNRLESSSTATTKGSATISSTMSPKAERSPLIFLTYSLLPTSLAAPATSLKSWTCEVLRLERKPPAGEGRRTTPDRTARLVQPTKNCRKNRRKILVFVLDMPDQFRLVCALVQCRM